MHSIEPDAGLENGAAFVAWPTDLELEEHDDDWFCLNFEHSMNDAVNAGRMTEEQRRLLESRLFSDTGSYTASQYPSSYWFMRNQLQWVHSPTLGLVTTDQTLRQLLETPSA